MSILNGAALSARNARSAGVWLLSAAASRRRRQLVVWVGG